MNTLNVYICKDCQRLSLKRRSSCVCNGVVECVELDNDFSIGATIMFDDWDTPEEDEAWKDL